MVFVYFPNIYDMFMGAEEIPGSSLFMRWWEQDVGQDVELHIYDYIYFENNWVRAVTYPPVGRERL